MPLIAHLMKIRMADAAIQNFDLHISGRGSRRLMVSSTRSDSGL